MNGVAFNSKSKQELSEFHLRSFFLPQFALRAGNEKDDGESADTVGCCSLRCEHVKLHKKLEQKNFVVV